MKKKAKNFAVHYKIPMLTADDKGCCKIMELHIHREKEGVRVRLKWGNKTSWWEYVEAR